MPFAVNASLNLSIVVFISMPGTEEDLDYRGLETGRRAQSVFVCPSCNANQDYQRPTRPGHCPHERTEGRREKSASFYESLALERGTRESVYESPLHAEVWRRVYCFLILRYLP